MDIVILGTVRSQFYLSSDHYVPERFIQKIDTMTNTIMENGLHQFFMSFCEFSRKVILSSYLDEADEEEQALTFEQLRRPMILVFSLWGIAATIFIAENMIFRWNHWLSHR